MDSHHSAPVTVERFRDLLTFKTPLNIVVACDSVGSIGSQQNDQIKVSSATSMHFALRVPILEIICAGAKPFLIVDTLTQDSEVSRPMIEEVIRIGASIGVDRKAITGSTEDNVPSTETGIGIVILGTKDSSLTTRASSGDVVICVGLPLSAPRDLLYPDHPEQIRIDEAQSLASSGLISDAVPVGSKGISWEASEMARASDTEFIDYSNPGVSFTDSGGPSSCVLFAIPPRERRQGTRSHCS